MDERWSERMPGRPRRGADSLEQGLDRLVSAGRQLVDGVSGARPGSRGPAGPAGSSRPRLADLGRWVEDKLDWILEEEDDWREPWQEERQGGRRRDPVAESSSRIAPQGAEPVAPLGDRRQLADRIEPAFPRQNGPSRRQPLQAISRRAAAVGRFDRSPASAAVPASEPDPALELDWPDDDSFSRSRWQRPPATVSRTPEPFEEAALRDRQPPSAAVRPQAPAAEPRLPRNAEPRPLPRSSRRRPG